MCKLWTIVVGFVKPRMDKTRDWNSQSRFHFSYTKPASSLIYSIYKIVNIRTVTNISNFLSYMLFLSQRQSYAGFMKNMKWSLFVRVNIFVFCPLNLRWFLHGSSIFYMQTSFLSAFAKKSNNKKNIGIKLFGHHYSDEKLTCLGWSALLLNTW